MNKSTYRKFCRTPNKLAIRRRDFLKGTVAAGAMLSFPTIVTHPVFGAAAPSNKITVAQIGCGGISHYHMGYLLPMEDVRVVAVADAYKSRREETAARLNKHYGGNDITRPYADFREILARPDIDAVIIAAHDNWHTPMSIAAAKAGKDVYCQKPLAMDMSLTKLLRQTIADTKRIFQFGTQYRSGGPKGPYRQMVQLVRNGYIGELKRIDLWCRDMSNDVDKYNVKPYGSEEVTTPPADLDFDAWIGPSPMVSYTVDRATCWGGYHCPETSLGFIAGCGIHGLGLAQWAVTNDDTSPIRYQGAGSVPTAGVFRTLERWDVNCDYANGVKLRFMDNRTAKSVATPVLGRWENGDGVIFHGTNGWIGWFSVADGFCASDRKIWTVDFKATDQQLPVAPEHNRNFIDCVKSREQTICPVEMGIRCDAICHLARAAALTGRVIRWDPAAEQVIDDPQASAMLAGGLVREKWRVW
jgi:predicted dehydrogenase